MRLALRCARDSIPPRRFYILLDLVNNSGSRVADVSKRVVMPWLTTRRELEALHMLGLLRCDEEQSSGPEEKTVWHYSLADSFDTATLQTISGNVMI